MKPIAVLALSSNNSKSICNSLDSLGLENFAFNQKGKITKDCKLIVPGIGTMKAFLGEIRELGLMDEIKSFIGAGGPTLGICLGMQLAGLTSEEFPNEELLSVMDFEVVRFVNEIGKDSRVPHMGWNEVFVTKENFLFQGIENASNFFFNHSFAILQESKHQIAESVNGPEKFSCAVVKENFAGVQFHPEKSQKKGLKLLKNFSEWDF
jgi:glutamine amidotransferase